MQKRSPYIRYTSRDFETIKTDLINYARKYYPNTFQDFNEGSFGSLMIDTVSYVGDIMSYYLDYQMNESFLDSATEYNNILKLGYGLGFRQKTNASAVGVATFYVSIPANAAGTSYNETYLPTISRGTTLQAVEGLSYVLLEDIVITPSTAEIRKTKINDRAPYQYTAKVRGKVISGVEKTNQFSIGDFEKFRKILVGDQSVTEIVSVTDSDGNVYYEVDYLTQNFIYRSIANGDPTTNLETPYIMKPFGIARRFIVVREEDRTYVQFGGAANTSTISSNNEKLDPSTVIIDKYGKNYSSDESFDPSLLITSDKLGIAPVNTVITVVYRTNSNFLSSTPKNSLNRIINPLVEFSDSKTIDSGVKFAIINSIQVTNELPIIGQEDDFTSDELKNKIYGTFAAQNRAVTELDYKAMCYNMPGKFGSIKRASILKDSNEIRRNINLYVVSQDFFGNLITTNMQTKNNLKNWLNKSKIINDTIDILDAKIVNFGISFTAMVDKNYNKYDVLSNGLKAVADEFSIKMDIGEAVQKARVYEALRRVEGLLDVRTVTFHQRTGQSVDGMYSSHTFNFEDNMTRDDMFLMVPKNVIMEIKYPTYDIEGKIF